MSCDGELIDKCLLYLSRYVFYKYLLSSDVDYCKLDKNHLVPFKNENFYELLFVRVFHCKSILSLLVLMASIIAASSTAIAFLT